MVSFHQDFVYLSLFLVLFFLDVEVLSESVSNRLSQLQLNTPRDTAAPPESSAVSTALALIDKGNLTFADNLCCCYSFFVSFLESVVEVIDQSSRPVALSELPFLLD